MLVYGLSFILTTKPDFVVGSYYEPYLWPRKTDRFKKLYIETIIRDPKKGRFFRPQVNPDPSKGSL